MYLQGNRHLRSNLITFFQGWNISSTCTDNGIDDRQLKSSSKYAVNGRYLYQHYAVCNAGENLATYIKLRPCKT